MRLNPEPNLYIHLSRTERENRYPRLAAKAGDVKLLQSDEAMLALFQAHQPYHEAETAAGDFKAR
jgi:hypothetical protein